jgi:hypothetical protein
MRKVKNIQQNNYDNLELLPVGITIFDRNGDDVTETFTGNIGRISIELDFDNTGLFVSDNNYYVDFGDGTTSDDAKPSHVYTSPGKYTITAIVVDKDGKFYKSKNVVEITVRASIPDRVTFTIDGEPTQRKSESRVKVNVYRINSDTASRTLSANGYKINLSVDKNERELITAKKYQNMPDFQFKKSCFFLNDVSDDFEIIDSVQTTSVNIYGKLEERFIFYSTTQTIDSFFLGTIGYGSFYYYED